MNYLNRDKIEEILKNIDVIYSEIDGLSRIEKELKNKYPRIAISWNSLSWEERIDISTHNHAIHIFCETIKETLNARLDALKESLINL